MKLINESIYCLGTGRISNCLNRLLHEVLACAPAIILLISFGRVKKFPLLEQLAPKNYSIFYSRVKVCTVN